MGGLGNPFRKGLCCDPASLSGCPTHPLCLHKVREPQSHSHLGSFLGRAQGSAIRAKDSAWLAFLTLKWAGQEGQVRAQL